MTTINGRGALLFAVCLLTGGCAATRPERPCFCVDVTEYERPVMLNSQQHKPGREITMIEREHYAHQSSSSTYGTGSGSVTVTQTHSEKQRTTLPMVKQLRAETRRKDQACHLTSVEYSQAKSDFIAMGASSSDATVELVVLGEMQ